MSGVRTGSRLEQLDQLLRRTKLELEAARRRHSTVAVIVELELLRDRLVDEISVLRPPTPVAVVSRPSGAPKRAADQRTSDLLAQLGVDSKQVKVWAHAQGLIPAVVQGRVAIALVQAYADAHRGADATA